MKIQKTFLLDGLTLAFLMWLTLFVKGSTLRLVLPRLS